MLTVTDLALSLGCRPNLRPILRGVSFSARPGQITAIVGPNGCGKSTLLRALTGELRPLGQITLDDVPISTLRPAELAQRRAVMAQSTRLAFPFTLHEVISLGLSAGLHAARPEIIPAVLRAVDLASRASMSFPDLSGGEQARGHLARSLAQVWDPVVGGLASWLLLDEPVASLDIGHQLLAMRVMADYAGRGGGVVTVMHDLNLTAMFAGHVVLMHDGRVLADGPPADVLTDALLSKAYHTPIKVGRVPRAGALFVLPQSTP